MKLELKQPWVKKVCALLLVIILTLAFVQLFAQVSFDYYSFSFKLQTQFNWEGGTRVAIPPVGQLFLKSHRFPWQLVITLDQIDLSKLEKQLSAIPPQEQWLPTFQKNATDALTWLLATVALYGLIGGVLALLIMRYYPPSRFFWYGLLTAVLVIAVLLGGIYATYDPHSLNHPQYQGVLAAAPGAMSLINMGLNNLEVIGNNLKLVSHDVSQLYQQAGKIQNLGQFDSDMAVLHVSDIHNNPAAFDFIEELVKNFKIAMIIDTGDLTDYGTALEAEIIPRIIKLGVPYIFVPGNHDSPLIIQRLKGHRSIWVLTSGLYKIYGLSIAGLADPASNSFNSDKVSTVEIAKATDTLTKRVLAMEQPPDIVAVHERDFAAKLIGKVPVILHGHDHKFRLSTTDQTIIVDAGTTGAAGLRGARAGDPYSAAILYWKKNDSGELKLNAVDSIKVNGVKGGLTIERHSFSQTKEQR